MPDFDHGLFVFVVPEPDKLRHQDGCDRSGEDSDERDLKGPVDIGGELFGRKKGGDDKFVQLFVQDADDGGQTERDGVYELFFDEGCRPLNFDVFKWPEKKGADDDELKE